MRRSQAIYIESEPPKRRLGSSSGAVPEEEETLSVLAPFNPVPRVDFGSVRLGFSHICRLRLRNPSSKSLLVSFEGVPSFEESGFSLDVFLSGSPSLSFVIPPRSDACLRLAWAPREPKGTRANLDIKYGSFKTHLQLIGAGTTHSTSRKVSRAKPPTQAPNPILHFHPEAPPCVPIGEPFPPPPSSSSPSPSSCVDSLRRETFTVEQADQATFVVPWEAPSKTHNILREIKAVRSQLEDCAGRSPSSKAPKDLLNDIRTEIICSPSRHRSSLRFDLYGEDKENNPPRAPMPHREEEDGEGGVDLGCRAFNEEEEEAQVLKEIIEENEIFERLEVGHVIDEGVTHLIEEEVEEMVFTESGVTQVVEWNRQVRTENPGASPRNQSYELSNISFNENSEVFLSPSANPYSEKELADVSLLVAQYMEEEEEVQREEEVIDMSVYETNVHEVKESFLMSTISEHHFLSIPEKGFCSTAVKDKSSRSLSGSSDLLQSSDVCKELFWQEPPTENNADTVNQTVTRRDTYCLNDEDRRVSSGTFTKSPEPERLHTIAEITEDYSSSCKTHILSDNTIPPTAPKSTKEESPRKAPGLLFVPLSGPPEKDEASTFVSETKIFSKISSISLKPSSSSSSPPKMNSKPRRPSINSIRPARKKSLKLIKMASGANTASSTVIRHPNLFSANNIYYDERWIEKQDKGFTKWLNFILTPSNDIFDISLETKKMDAAKLWFACSEASKVPRAPTREVMSYRAYTAGREMNNLRISAVRLWQSQGVIEVIRRLEVEIEKKRLYVRDDRCLNKDLGMKQSFLSLLLNYNPLWLRIGLETIYGEVLHVTGNSDILGISRFIITRLLCNPAISEEYIHPTVPHLHRPGYQDALKKFTLKKFLQLIYFLDTAKNGKLIKHNPCLFCKDADFKMSRDLLLDFSKRFLAGEGDVTKHLRYFGYDVSHKQTALDEFDFAVENIAVDLRCGVRLCRVLDIVLDKDLTPKTRVPAISKLQKIYNTNIALEALKASEGGLPKDISSKDIVNGHMEKTLDLIWHIIFGLRLKTLLSPEKWAKEISLLRKSLVVHSYSHESAASGLRFVREKDGEDSLETDETVQNILLWSRLVCAHYGIEVENLSVSFSDGRALCFLLHHYYPSLLSKEEIMMNTTISTSDKEEEALTMETAKLRNDGLLTNEKMNFKLFHERANELGGVPILIRSLDMSNTIPDRKITMTFLAYFASRLLDLSNEINAARIIQLTWRKKRALRNQRLIKIRNQAAITIQRRVRLFLRTLRMKKVAGHVLTIQRYYRGYSARLCVRNIRESVRIEAAKKIQSWWRVLVNKRIYIRRLVLVQAVVRGFIQRKRYSNLRLRALFVQRKWRGLLETRRIQREFLCKLEATRTLQRLARGTLARRRFARLKEAASLVQSWWRTTLALKETQKRQENAVVLIQAYWRGAREREVYKRTRYAVILIQRRLRSFLSLQKARIEYKRRVELAIRLQAAFRGRRDRVHYLRLREATIRLQALVRCKRARTDFQALKSSTLLIQRALRRTIKTRRIKHQRHLKEEQGAIHIQSFFKCVLVRRRFVSLRKSTLFIQRRWRWILKERKICHEAALVIQRNMRIYVRRVRDYHFKVVKVQSCIRRYLSRKELIKRQEENYLRKKDAGAIIIQSAFRGYAQRMVFLRLRRSTFFIQERWRFLKTQELRLYRIIKIQSLIRGYLARRKCSRIRTLDQHQRSSKTIQRAYRAYVQRREYLKLLSAVRFIQDRYRYLQRLKYIRLVIQAQSFVRRYLAKKELIRRMSLVNQHYSATIIQAAYRGFVRRREYAKLRQSTLLCQERWRYLKIVRRIIKIQSWVRGYLARKELQRRREVVIRHESATLIQSAFRSYSLRRSYLLLKTTTLFIQARWRYFQHLDKKKELFNSRVIKIQSLVRRYLALKELHRRRKSSQASLVIQRAFRSYILRQKYLRLKDVTCFIQTRWKYIKIMREKRIHRIIRAQSLIRGFLSRQRHNRMLSIQVKAATTIQSAVRCCQQRQSYMRLRRAVRFVVDRFRYNQLLRKRRRSVIKLQSIARGFLIRRNLRLQRNSQEKAAIKLQSIVRGFLIRRNLQHKRNSQEKAAIKLQSIVRGFLIRRNLQHKRNAQEKAALIIQETFRGILHRRRFMRLKKSVLLIQSRWRFIQRVRERRIIVVQSLIRRYLAKKDLNQRQQQRDRMVAAVVCAQAAVRGYIQRRKFRRIVRTVRFVQERVRYIRVLRERRKIRNIVKLQSIIRGYLVRKRRNVLLLEEKQRKEHELHASQCFKQSSSSLEYLSRLEDDRQRKEAAAVLIQSFVKGTASRRRYLRLKRTVCFLQDRIRFLRTLRMRKTLNKKMNSNCESAPPSPPPPPCKRSSLLLDTDTAATRIQRLTRTWIARRRFKRVIQSVVVVQSFWRGYRTRKHLLGNTRLSEVRARLVFANKEATDNKKLCNRVSYVLCHLFDIKSLAVLIKIVSDLDASTRYSEVCCDQMMEYGERRPVVVLLDLIGRCNKSVPHIEVISGVLNTLINLARYERTRLYMSGLEETYKTCLETLHRFEKNQSLICAKVFSFLYVLTFEEKGREGVKKLSKRLKDYLREYERKKLLLQRGPKPKTSRPKKTIPHTPEWMCTKGFRRCFEDPIIALKALLMRLPA